MRGHQDSSTSNGHHLLSHSFDADGTNIWLLVHITSIYSNYICCFLCEWRFERAVPPSPTWRHHNRVPQCSQMRKTAPDSQAGETLGVHEACRQLTVACTHPRFLYVPPGGHFLLKWTHKVRGLVHKNPTRDQLISPCWWLWKNVRHLAGTDGGTILVLYHVLKSLQLCEDWAVIDKIYQYLCLFVCL